MSSKISKPRSPCDAEISCDWILVLASSDSLELNLKRFWSSAASAVLTKSHISPDNSLSVFGRLSKSNVLCKILLLRIESIHDEIACCHAISTSVINALPNIISYLLLLLLSFCSSYHVMSLEHIFQAIKFLGSWRKGRGGHTKGEGVGSRKRPWAMKKLP